MAKNVKKSKQKALAFASVKEERLYHNLLKITEQFMSGKGFSSLTEHELMQRLSLPPQHAMLFNMVLNTLTTQEMVELVGERYSWKSAKDDVMTGVLNAHPRGFGFVQAHDPIRHPQDIFIPKHLMNNAVDGDTVEVLVNTDVISDKGPEGRIISILARGRTHMAGIVRGIGASGEVYAFVPLLGEQQDVLVDPESSDRKLQVGDRIVMEVIEWGTKETETTCRMSHYIGHISDPSCDVKAAIEEFELRSDFSHDTLEEAKQFGQQVSRKEIAEREDLRDLVTVTIDPDTAKDYDDAISLTKEKNGYYKLGVHIADVSHYVKPGTALDDEAQIRCNSTYFPGQCVPMLPSVLSDSLCSLKPNVNRLTVSILALLDPTGEVVNYSIARTVIKSAHRFTYREAKQVLDGQKKSKHADLLALMVEVCQLLKRKRYERGSLEFAMPELVVIVDKDGVPQKTDYVEYDITHQMVEEFMLKANELVALHLSNQGKNLAYRVHDVPAEEHLRDFAVLATAFGFRLPDKPSPQDLQKLFEEAIDTPYGRYLATSYIRRMRQALYSAENLGHYGLSLTHYCHFTSPIRRYIDLVIHRLLFLETDNLEYLQDIAERCSEQERISAKAEGRVVLLKKMRLLQDIHNKSAYNEYEAVVTRVKNFGIYFEVLNLMLEGFLHVSELDQDFFVFEEKTQRLRGVYHGYGYGCGDSLTVMLKDVDLILLESKWYLVSSAPKAKTGQEEKREGKKAKKKIQGKERKERKKNPEKVATKKKQPIKPTIKDKKPNEHIHHKDTEAQRTTKNKKTITTKKKQNHKEK
jgi:ribonuclease R